MLDRIDAYFHSMLFQDHIVILLTAALLNVIFLHDYIRDKLPTWLNPFFYTKKLILTAEAKLNRTHRPSADRFLRGLILTILLIIAAALLGKELQAIKPMFKHGWLVEAAILALLMPMRQVGDVVTGLMLDFERISLKEMREKLDQIYVNDASVLDHFTLFRIAAELCARSLVERMLSLALWYIIFGLPGVFVHCIISQLNEAIGYSDERFNAFGTTASGLYILANIAATPVATIMLLIAAIPAPLSKPHYAFAALAHTLKNPMQLPYAVMAGALNIRLLGPRPISKDYTIEQNWVEEDRTDEPVFTHVRTAYAIYKLCWIMYVGTLLWVVM